MAAPSPIAFDAKTVAAAKRLKDSAADHGITMTLSTPGHGNTPARSVTITPDDAPGLTKVTIGYDWDVTIMDYDIEPPLFSEFCGDEFLVAHNLREVAEDMIQTFPELSHIGKFRMTYLWKAKGGMKGEKHRLGNCEKTSGMKQFFAKADFIIWLACDHAKTLGMTSRQLEALLYHELCHASFEEKDNGEEVTKVAQHDVELFHDEIRRYGLWTTDLETARETFRQAQIPFGSVAAGTAA